MTRTGRRLQTGWATQSPQAGDSLSFPSVGTGLSPVNDMTVASFVSIDISGSGYTLGGNAVTLQSGLTNEGSRNTVDLNLTLGASQEFDNNSGSTLTIGGTTVGNIDLGGYTLTIAGSGGETDCNGIISDTGDLIAASSGRVVLAGANTYQGTTQVRSGVLAVSNATGLGNTDGQADEGTTLDSGRL